MSLKQPSQHELLLMEVFVISLLSPEMPMSAYLVLVELDGSRLGLTLHL